MGWIFRLKTPGLQHGNSGNLSDKTQLENPFCQASTARPKAYSMSILAAGFLVNGVTLCHKSNNFAENPSSQF